MERVFVQFTIKYIQIIMYNLYKKMGGWLQYKFGDRNMHVGVTI